MYSAPFRQLKELPMNQAVIITGASAGIGKATGLGLAAAGYTVINLDRASCSCDAMTTVQIDLRNKPDIVTAIGDVARNHTIVGLVNNAGLARTAALEETDEDLLTSTFDVNLTVAAICAREVLPTMKAQGYGRIVNVSSRSAQGRELRTAYAASKGGLISMTRVWALELGASGITANCVAPGPVATELFDQMNPDGSDRRNKMVRDIPVGRIGRPEDVAHAVQFFLSRDSGYINGQTLYVCGGLSAGVAPL